jgi:hypothetical protein
MYRNDSSSDHAGHARVYLHRLPPDDRNAAWRCSTKLLPLGVLELVGD